MTDEEFERIVASVTCAGIETPGSLGHQLATEARRARQEAAELRALPKCPTCSAPDSFASWREAFHAEQSKRRVLEGRVRHLEAKLRKLAMAALRDLT